MDVAPYRYKRTWVSLIQNTKIQLQIQNTNWNTKYKQPLPSLTLHLTCKHLPRANSADWRHSPFSLDHSFDDDDDADKLWWWWWWWWWWLWWRIKAFAFFRCNSLFTWPLLSSCKPAENTCQALNQFHFTVFLFFYLYISWLFMSHKNYESPQNPKRMKKSKYHS